MKELSSKLTGVLIIALCISAGGYAQVGINTDDPHESAVLHIYSTNRGVLFPALSKGDLISNPADGLMIYNSTSKMFNFFNISRNLWQPVSPLIPEGAGYHLPFSLHVSHPVVIDSSVTMKQKVTITDSRSELAGYGTIPIGGIIMWSGTVIPEGWALCDGKTTSSGILTPDLRGRFIVGYGSNAVGLPVPGIWDADYTNPGNLSLKGTSPGETGGRSSNILTAADMPAHSHSINMLTQGAGEHNHPFELEPTDGAVTGLIRTGANNGTPSIKIGGYYVTADSVSGTNIKIEYSGLISSNVIHVIPNHKHFIYGRTKTEGTSTGAESRPAYYVLAFIMRIK